MRYLALSSVLLQHGCAQAGQPGQVMFTKARSRLYLSIYLAGRDQVDWPAQIGAAAQQINPAFALDNHPSGCILDWQVGSVQLLYHLTARIIKRARSAGSKFNFAQDC